LQKEHEDQDDEIAITAEDRFHGLQFSVVGSQFSATVVGFSH
jgi:hypothetical protein